jgi:hypothetical protein
MAYTDFTLELAEQRLGITTGIADLFPDLAPLEVSAELTDRLQKGREFAAFVSEKSRSEFLVVPILMAAREFVTGELTVFSGIRLDVDPSRGLVGECDYVLARTSRVPRLRAPLVTVMEAKRGDIELGLGQLVAQMVAAQVFNERAGTPVASLFGVITTGEDWQFLRLDANSMTMHQDRYYLNNLGSLLAALRVAISTT